MVAAQALTPASAPAPAPVPASDSELSLDQWCRCQRRRWRRRQCRCLCKRLPVRRRRDSADAGAATVPALRLAVRCAAPLCERLRAEARGELPPKAGEAERGRSRTSTSRNAMQAAADMQASLLEQLRQLQQLQRVAAAHGAQSQAELEADEMLRDLVEHVTR